MVLGFEGRFLVSIKWISLVLMLLLAVGLSSVSAENETNTTLLNITTNSSIIPTPSDIYGVYYVLDDQPLDETNLTNITINDSSLTPLPGEVSQFNEGYYVLLGDDNSEEELGYNLTVSSIDRIEVEVGSKVSLKQKATILNTLNVSETFSINLWDYVGDVLASATEVKVYLDGNLISEQPIFFAHLNSNQTLVYDVEYVFPEIKMTTVCTTKTIRDLLPRDALVLSSKISLDTVIEETCDLAIEHNGAFYYVDIIIPVEMLSSNNIRKITYVEGNRTLEVKNQTLVLTR